MQHLDPQAAFAFLQARPEALFVDVRMEIEYLYVGHPPGVVNLAWYEYPELQPDAGAFVEQVRREAGRVDRPVVLICRSGKRTLEAGRALEAAGFRVAGSPTELPQLLRDAGYRTGHFGKWHLGAVKTESPLNPGRMGFDEFLAHDNFFEMDPPLSRNGAPPRLMTTSGFSCFSQRATCGAAASFQSSTNNGSTSVRSGECARNTDR